MSAAGFLLKKQTSYSVIIRVHQFTVPSPLQHCVALYSAFVVIMIRFTGTF